MQDYHLDRLVADIYKFATLLKALHIFVSIRKDYLAAASFIHNSVSLHFEAHAIRSRARDVATLLLFSHPPGHWHGKKWNKAAGGELIASGTNETMSYGYE